MYREDVSGVMDSTWFMTLVRNLSVQLNKFDGGHIELSFFPSL